MSTPAKHSSAEGGAADPRWKDLYRVGGIAPLVAVAFYLIELLSLLSGEPFPVAPEDWFSLFLRHKFLGLLYLNALDILSITLLGVMFLALVAALWRGHESAALIAIGLTLGLLYLGGRPAGETNPTTKKETSNNA